VLYTHTQANKQSDKLMSTNIRKKKRIQPVRKKKSQNYKFFGKDHSIPAGASPKKKKKKKIKISLKKKSFFYRIPAALAPPRRKLFLTSGRAN